MAALFLATDKIADSYIQNAAQLAAYEGHFAMVQLLLDTGKILDESKNLIFTYMAEYNQLPLLKQLLAANMPIEVACTALNLAAKNGHTQIVDALIDASPGFSEQAMLDASAQAVANGQQQMVDHLFARNALSPEYRYFLLHAFVSNNHLQGVKMLLSSDLQVDFVPIFLDVLRGGNKEMAALFLATDKITDSHIQITAQHAAYEGHFAMVQLLLDTGKIDQPCIENIFIFAAQLGNQQFIETMLGKYKCSEFVGAAALLAASKNGQEEMVDFLLRSQITTLDCVNATCLQMHQQNGNGHELIQTLAVKIVDAMLLCAAKLGQTEIQQMILDSGRPSVNAQANAELFSLRFALQHHSALSRR